MPRQNLPQNAGSVRDLASELKDTAKKLDALAAKMERAGFTEKKTLTVAHVRKIEEGQLGLDLFMRELDMKIDLALRSRKT